MRPFHHVVYLLIVLLVTGCSADTPGDAPDQSSSQTKPPAHSEPESEVATETRTDAPLQNKKVDQDKRYRQLVVGTWERIGRLALWIVVGGGSYFAALFLSGIRLRHFRR